MEQMVKLPKLCCRLSRLFGFAITRRSVEIILILTTISTLGPRGRVASFMISTEPRNANFPPDSTTDKYHGTPRSTVLHCQLLGMNCATPTDFTFSFQGFCRRGGETDVHADGWGVAFYQDGGVRQFHDVEAASKSPLAQYLGQQPIQTVNMMGHIRYATQGQVNLANVHPFTREMWGIPWCFCHNGEVPLFSTNSTNLSNEILEERKPLPKLKSLCENPTEYYYPVGTTDSEATFCAILNSLRCKFTTLPSLPILHEALKQLCNEIAMHDPDGTILNFLLTCGPHTQWVYSWPGSRPGSKVWNGLHYTVREYPFSKVRLCDMDYTVDFSTVTSKDDCVSVIATQPLRKH